ncbi:uncharacterized protein LOC116301150 [Actinia tenebrosa]|uniref:Uncharacterized protein LOC116301150 n=1 Tax=Actinia tenebrosa TaxID=6105 RepID=A0A6P8IHC6_ACTTE|nr:uncharacterized protein LOC116301150 [Actinia tenebrosa]
MNYTSKSSVGGDHASKGKGLGLKQRGQVYNSASEALDAYISAFEKRTNYYTRSSSDLLAPKPKFYFMDSLERSLLGSPGKSPGQKVDDLVAWVNQTYNQDVNSRVQPFGLNSNHGVESFPGSRGGQTRTTQYSSRYSPSRRVEVDELSSLPSPSSSVVDLDSNAGTVETDILLSSYKGEKPEDAYSRSNIYEQYPKARPTSLKVSGKSPKQYGSNIEYPSWVSSLGKEYPSWVEDLDSTALSKKASRSPQHKYSSTVRTSPKINTSSSSLDSKRELKVSDLKVRTPPSKSRTTKTKHLSLGKADKEYLRDWTDTASMDTDILLSQPMYGDRPVNMGGDLHQTLHKDQKVTRLKKESTKKLKKSSEKSRSRARERTQISPRSKSVLVTPDHGVRAVSPREYQSAPPKSRMRPEASVSPSSYRDYSPLRSGHLRPSPERLELKPTQFSMPVRSPNFRSTEIYQREEYPSPMSKYTTPSTDKRHSPVRSHARESEYRGSGEEYSSPMSKYTSPSTDRRHSPVRSHTRESEYRGSGEEYSSPMSKYTSPSTDRRHSPLSSHARESGYNGSVTRKPPSPSHIKHSGTRSRKSKDSKPGLGEDADKDASDTDREMRKSPTGIKMEKVYRDPSTMYPWKTMIQSRNHKSVAFSDGYSPGLAKPVYKSTPAVKNEAIASQRYMASKVPSRDLSGNVTQPEEYVTRRITHYFPKASPGLKSAPPQPVFTSTSQTIPTHKPPIAPRSLDRLGKHQRSRTMPDLRTIGSGVKSLRHSKGRRSYDDDLLSVVTSDTEVLLTQPPMPIVDVSPSLTTVSDSSDTIVGSDTESERETYRRSSPTRSIPVRQEETSFNSAQGGEGEKFSPTSAFASSSPYAAVREELPKRYHLWKLDDDTTAPDSFIKKKHVASGKSTIISSFLEDCLNIDDKDSLYDYNRNLIQNSSQPVSTRLSGREGAPGPVEALKNMLFTMQDMAHHKDAAQRDEEPQSCKSLRAPLIRPLDEDIKDDQSEASSQLFHGEESLQRAYHHLQRLKRLVGSEDDQSSVDSEI